MEQTRRIKTSDDILRFYVDMGANATREGIIMRVEQLPSNQLQCLEVCDVERQTGNGTWIHACNHVVKGEFAKERKRECRENSSEFFLSYC